MGKKSKLPYIFKNREANPSSWQWPSCTHTKTLSFRADDDIFKTVNSIYFDPCNDQVETPESWFTNSSESASFSTESEECLGTGEPEEMIIRGVRSERLFFDPGNTTSSILDKQKTEQVLDKEDKDNEEEEEDEDEDQELPFKESVMLAMESEDPYLDFKRSMQEMVESHGIKDWECLQELLGWYLKMNGKVNHGFIVGAFMDLLIELHHPPIITCTSHDSITSYSSAASSFSSPSSPMSSLGHKVIQEQE